MGCTLCTFQTCFFDHKMTETGMRQHKEGVRLKGEKEIQTERERKTGFDNSERMTRHKQRGIEARKILRNRETRVKRRCREWDWERFSKKREWEIEKMRERSGIWSQTSPEMRLYSSVREKRVKHHFRRTLQTDKKKIGIVERQKHSIWEVVDFLAVPSKNMHERSRASHES